MFILEIPKKSVVNEKNVISLYLSELLPPVFAWILRIKANSFIKKLKRNGDKVNSPIRCIFFLLNDKEVSLCSCRNEKERNLRISSLVV